MATTKGNQNLVNEITQSLANDLAELGKAFKSAKTPDALRGILAKTPVFTRTREVAGQWRAQLDAKQKEQQVKVQATAQHLDQSIENRVRRIEAYALRKRAAIPPATGKFIVAGRVTDRDTGVPLPNVLVKAYDLDPKTDELLGQTRTDALGYYRIEYTEKDLKDDRDKKPEVYIDVLNDAGQSIYTSPKCLSVKSGAVEFIEAAVNGSAFPLSLQQGTALTEALKGQLQKYDQRRQLLTTRAETRLDLKLSIPSRTVAAPATILTATESAKVLVQDQAPAAAKPIKASTTRKRPGPKTK